MFNAEKLEKALSFLTSTSVTLKVAAFALDYFGLGAFDTDCTYAMKHHCHHPDLPVTNLPQMSQFRRDMSQFHAFGPSVNHTFA